MEVPASFGLQNLELMPTLNWLDDKELVSWMPKVGRLVFHNCQ